VFWKWQSKAGKEQGFSLVELMIVVGIIGVLATLAVPRFKQFERKAKMAEVRNLIQHIATLEESYRIDNNVYINLGPLGAGGTTLKGGNNCNFAGDAGATAIGFSIDPCDPNGLLPRYYYRVTGASSALFVASGTTGNIANNRVCPGNDHHWIGVNQNKQVYGVFQSNSPVNSTTLPDLTPVTACPLN
jgi:prepilin-type N-terminal cleavage/methylation domain-containing protein